MWRWLEDVVSWFNHEYAWDTSQVIPDCWPEHPHLVHEIAVPGRRPLPGSSPANSGGPLEDWHRSAFRGSSTACARASRPTARNAIRHGRPAHRYARHVSQESFDHRRLRSQRGRAGSRRPSATPGPRPPRRPDSTSSPARSETTPRIEELAREDEDGRSEWQAGQAASAAWAGLRPTRGGQQAEVHALANAVGLQNAALVGQSLELAGSGGVTQDGRTRCSIAQHDLSRVRSSSPSFERRLRRALITKCRDLRRVVTACHPPRSSPRRWRSCGRRARTAAELADEAQASSAALLRPGSRPQEIRAWSSRASDVS